MQKLIFVSFFILNTIQVHSQSIYYVRPDNPYSNNEIFYFGLFDVSNCKDSILFQIKNTSGVFTINDIAVCPDGEFYLAIYNYSFPYEQIAKLNMQDSSLVVLGDFSAGNSMVCDGDGIIWSGPNLNTYNTNNGTINAYGYIGYDLGGDLTFRNGVLFGTTINNELIEINPNDISSTHVVYQYPLSGLMAFGVVSDSKSCDSTITYITTTNFSVNSDVDSINAIYAIDPVAQTTTFICTTPRALWGATTTSEFLAADCTLRLDLDADNSSGASGGDWQAPVVCAGNSQVLADTDATWYSGYHTDSMRVRLLAPAPDVPLEYLSANAAGSVVVTGQGSPRLSLVSQPNTAVPVSNTDFQAVLRSLRWHNDAAQPTPGLRTVEVIAFGSGARSDTAFAYLEVPPVRSAGLDTTFSICADHLPFALSTPGGASGGAWSATTLGNGIFSPQTDLPGAYIYAVTNGICPSDTAQVTIAILPLPVFSLGVDTAFCSGTTHHLQAPGNALWQDGSTSPDFVANSPGLYWAEYIAGNGCTFRDSVVLDIKLPAQGQNALQRCAGQPYQWNGQTFATDTTVCKTFIAANGCDSVHCLSLSFFYPTLALDTSICSGQVLQWLGASYSSGGIFTDTILFNGCFTHTTLSLKVGPPDSLVQQTSICAGETYTVGVQSFSTSGIYTIPLKTATGCDSIVLLHLAVQPPAFSAISAAICPGSTYLFDGMERSSPGTYAAHFQTAAGCDSTVTLTLGLLPAPAPQISGDTLICIGNTTTLTVGLYAAYQWSDGSSMPAINTASPGIYSITITDSNGCTAADSLSVIALPPLNATWATTDPQCPGANDGGIKLTGSSGGLTPLAFSLNGSAPTDSSAFTSLTAGEYSIQITDALGCTGTFTLTLNDPPMLEVSIGPDQLLEIGVQYHIPLQINQNGVFNYQWSPPEGLDCTVCPSPLATATDSIIYALLLTNEHGCEATDSILIRVIKGEGIYVPQIFSPNGDGRNESFTIYGDPELVRDIEVFRIYDRWGELVFQQAPMAINDEANGWDGAFQGRPVLPGVYVWYAEIRMLNGAVRFKKGEVTVFR